MKNLLIIIPPYESKVCLQDILWYYGDWGYFKKYTLGAITAAQLFVKAKAYKPEILESLFMGDFDP